MRYKCVLLGTLLTATGWPAAVKTAASSLTFQSDVPHAGVGPVTVDDSAQVLASKAATQGRHSQGTGKGVLPMGLLNGDTWRKRRRQSRKVECSRETKSWR